MEKAKRTDFSNAKLTVKGYCNSIMVIGSFTYLLISVFLFVTIFQIRNNIPENSLITLCVVGGVLAFLGVAFLVFGMWLKSRRSNQVCFAAYDDYAVVFVTRGKIKGYTLVNYAEITEYGFYHKISNQASSGSPYFKSDMLNYGVMVLKCGNEELRVPVADIETVRNCLNDNTNLTETAYQRVV